MTQPDTFDIGCDRLAHAEGYLTTALRSVQRTPATNPLMREQREALVGDVGNALALVKRASERLIELERDYRAE